MSLKLLSHYGFGGEQVGAYFRYLYAEHTKYEKQDRDVHDMIYNKLYIY